MKRIILISIIIIPYVLMYLLIKDFTEHVNFEIKNTDVVMMNSYYLGCIQQNKKLMQVCKTKAKEFKIKS